MVGYVNVAMVVLESAPVRGYVTTLRDPAVGAELQPDGNNVVGAIEVEVLALDVDVGISSSTEVVIVAVIVAAVVIVGAKLINV